MRISKRWLVLLVSIFVVFAVLGVVSRKYIWLYVSRTPDPRPPVADLLRDAQTSKNPEILLAEANRLAWLFNWPKAEPLYVRAQELFKERGDTRNEVYARVGRIRAQSETMSFVDVSEMLGKQLEIPVAKTDLRLRLWCLAARGYTDLEINPPSAKRAWTEAQRIAHTLGEAQWEARATGELGIIAFLEGDSRRAATMVGDALLSAIASGDLGVGDVPYQNQGGASAKLAKPVGVGQRLLRGFSDAFGTPLYDLPQTREEVIEVSKIVGNDGVMLLGSNATETAFKSQPLEDFKIIHLAAHGFADTQFPERSGLVLGVDANSHDDGLLQVHEIIRLRFNADLVTLSACNTGVGKLQGEEGVTNLVEAFLVSGAKAVVASLWSADDTYTLALMERFYTHIAEGQDKAAALRHAKLDLLTKYGRQVSPYYWGAFVIVGDGGSPIALRVQ